MRPRTVFRTSREVRDAAKLNQLAVRPLLLDDEQGEAAEVDGDLMGGGGDAEFGGSGEPGSIKVGLNPVLFELE